MTTEEIKKTLESQEYDFLRTNEHIKDRVVLLTLGGSYAYGTNCETSDVDVRGVCLSTPRDLIGLGKFESFSDPVTDTTIFGTNRFMELMLSCNPNILEIVGCKPEHYFVLEGAGKFLFDNRKVFFSSRIVKTFGGYAKDQLRRLENAVARDRVTQPKKEEHIRASLIKAVEGFRPTDPKAKLSKFRLYGSPSCREEMEEETYVSLTMTHYPVRDLKGLVGAISGVIRDYDLNINARNRKKDDLHLNKHAMHLVRLYLEAIDMLETGDIHTYREKEHDLLMQIRSGYFQKEDGTFDSAFFDLVEDVSLRFDYARENTSLPREPDMGRVEDVMMHVNNMILR